MYLIYFISSSSGWKFLRHLHNAWRQNQSFRVITTNSELFLRSYKSQNSTRSICMKNHGWQNLIHSNNKEFSNKVQAATFLWAYNSTHWTFVISTSLPNLLPHIELMLTFVDLLSVTSNQNIVETSKKTKEYHSRWGSRFRRSRRRSLSSRCNASRSPRNARSRSGTRRPCIRASLHLLRRRNRAIVHSSSPSASYRPLLDTPHANLATTFSLTRIF